MLSTAELSKLDSFLEPAWIVIVATIGPDGMPQLTPNWYVFEDGRIAISTTKERVKYRNLSRDDRISLCICAEPLAKEYATIWGRAEIFDDDSIWPVTQRILERYAAPSKMEDRMAVLRTQDRVIVSVTPDRVMFRS